MSRFNILNCTDSIPLNSRGKTSTYQKSYCQNKLIWFNGFVWAKTSGIPNNLIIRLRNYLQRAGQGSVLKTGLSLACPGFDQSRLAELILSFQCSLNSKVINQSALSSTSIFFLFFFNIKFTTHPTIKCMAISILYLGKKTLLLLFLNKLWGQQSCV